MGARLDTWSASLVAATLVVLSVGACGEDEGVAQIDGEAYAVAMSSVLPVVDQPDPRPVVFVVPIGEGPLTLDEQVAVIDWYAEQYDIRFVDSVDAAIDPDVDGSPPRDDGVLLGLGTMSQDRPHVVRIEEYRSASAVSAHLLTVVRRSSAWAVTLDEPVEPEALGDVG